MVFDPSKRENREQKKPGAEVQAENLDLREKEKHLKDYLEGMGKLDPREKRDFFAKTMEWERSGDFNALRRAGRTESEDSRDSMKKYTLLSSLYLQRDLSKPGDVAFKIKFDSALANQKVGLGDMAPPEAKSVKVWNEKGDVVTEDAFRAIDPSNGRIGYYDRKIWEETKTYKYIAVFDDYSFAIRTTGDYKDPEVARRRFAEHSEIFENKRPALAEGLQRGPDNRLASLRGGPIGGTTAPATPSSSAERPKRTMQIASNYAEIDGEKYEMGGQRLWKAAIGETAAQASEKLSFDPITGGPLTFLGRPLQWRDEKTGKYYPIKVCRYIISALKEAECICKEEGIDYDITDASCFNWREKRGREGTGDMSDHSWGTAIDINPGRNPWKSHRTDIPQRFVEIMESVGFKWGGDWGQFGKTKSDVWQSPFGRPDPMHFQYQLNPGKTTKLLKHAESQKYAAVCLKDWPEIKSAESPEPRYATQPAAKEGGNINAGLNTRITSKLWKFDPIITEASQKYNVPKSLIMAVMFQESGGDPLTASGAGAGGLMQLMPATAKHMGFNNVYDVIAERNAKGRMTYHLDPRDDRADPYKSVMAGAKLLGQLLKRYKGNTELALASYNWGSGNVDKFIKGEKKMPKETRDYIARIPAMSNSLESGAQKTS
jgi:hypothetical protein